MPALHSSRAALAGDGGGGEWTAPVNIQTADGDRSVYSVIFETTTSSRNQLRTNAPAPNQSINEFTLMLPEWTASENNNTNLNGTVSSLPSNVALSAKLPSISQDAHQEFSDALYQMGRNASFVVDPEPLIKTYTELSEDFERRLREMITTKSVSGVGELRNLMEFFHKEKFTWKLVWSLLIAAQGGDSAGAFEEMADFRLPASDAEEIDDLFDSSFDFRKIQTLVDWLENRYGEEKCTSNTASLHAYKEGGGMYEATHRALTSGRASDDVISELDPDAPIRQQRVLHEQDTEDEQRFFRCVFELVRAGRLADAQRLAMDQGHFLLAAGMEGWKAFKGNNRDDEGNLLPDEGNPYRDVWKMVVWKKIADDRVPVAEKAVYASLSGSLEALLALCSTWEDHLWAHLKTMVDVAIELHLRNARGADIGPLPEEYPKESESLEHVLKNLESLSELEANDFFRQLHKFLMLQDAEGLLAVMFKSCAAIVEEDVQTAQVPSHQLRLMANLALFLRYNRLEDRPNADEANDPVNFIVAFYVDRLILDGLHQVVPKYVLHLPSRLREQCYLTFLRKFRYPTDAIRVAIIEAAQKESIDIYSYLTKFVYETIYNESQATAAHSAEIAETDLQQIDALKWLFAQQGHSLLGLQYVNSALRSAVLSRRLQMVRRLIDLVPIERVHQLAVQIAEGRSNDGSGEQEGNMAASRFSRAQSEASAVTMDVSEDGDDMDDSRSSGSDRVDPIRCKRALKEYFCFQVYLEAHHSFTEWFEHFHRNKPQEQVPVVDSSSSARSTLTAEFAKKSLASRRELWQSTLSSLCDRTAGHLYSILTYQDGGFLQDPPEDDPVDERQQPTLDEETRRLEELRALRRICLPEVVSLLHNVLHGTGRYTEAIEIANLVAGEALSLYKEFSKEDMAALLVRIQESSVEILKAPGRLDPYGLEDIQSESSGRLY